MMNATNVTNFVQLINFANTSSEGWFSAGMLISLFVIVLMGSLRTDAKGALVTASFITVIAAILLRVMGLIQNFLLIITIMILFVMILVLFLSDKQ